MSNNERLNFVDACLQGVALLEDVDDWVDEWSDGGGCIEGASLPLRDHLGMSEAEYGLWVEQDSALRLIIASRRYKVPVETLLTSDQDYAVAARSADERATREVLMWLVETGRVAPGSAMSA